MTETILEFRGIRLSHLETYFEELGGIRKTNELPIRYEGEQWSAEILSEKEISFTKTFKVNAVHIRFVAKTEEELASLLKNYRYKTTRIGG
ncbi:hypothetical protein D1B31_13505 [Neobacillus notoginsengisoli]|uniref:Molybdopterin cofactor biosynthesis MoaD-related C-terminal domain-containing protein n=1 Tax=Neobacillus notoginsengisoli TaxID=1578198 RepID=A0A417YSL5_9BACI|nr:hypothetical protein [Neobacillus notoginsengisoli]RHW38979.1 hypothetical protein D1B31_13505 [Neobacillus notoginsengisoli]